MDQGDPLNILSSIIPEKRGNRLRQTVPHIGFRPSFAGLDCIIDILYRKLCNENPNFYRKVSYSAFAYYCAVGAYYRALYLKSARGGGMKYDERAFLDFYDHCSDRYVFPKLLTTYLSGFGTFRSMGGVEYQFELMDRTYQTEEGISGWFGRFSSSTHFLYTNIPCLAVYVNKMIADLRYTANPDGPTDWHFPDNITPTELNHGFPTVNVLGYRPALKLLAEQVNFLKENGVIEGQITSSFNSIPFLNSLMFGVNTYLSCRPELYKTELTPIEGEKIGSIGQICQQHLDLNRCSTTPFKESVFINKSTEYIDPAISGVSAAFLFRPYFQSVKTNEAIELNTWSAYEFQSYSAVPQEWINSRNAIHENESPLLSCGPLQSAPYLISHLLDSMTAEEQKYKKRTKRDPLAYNLKYFGGGLSPSVDRIKFRPSFAGLDGIIKILYQKLNSQNRNFRKNVSYCAFAYYCAVGAYYRALLLKSIQSRSHITSDEQLFINKCYDYVFPELLTTYLSGFGSFRSMGGVEYQFELMDRTYQTEEGISGWFGRFSSSTHFLYTNIPCLAVYVNKMIADLRYTANPDGPIDWHFPDNITPIELNAGYPTLNVLGYRAAEKLRNEQVNFLIQNGVIEHKLGSRGLSIPLLPILMYEVQSYVERAQVYRTELIKRLNTGTIGQICHQHIYPNSYISSIPFTDRELVNKSTETIPGAISGLSAAFIFRPYFESLKNTEGIEFNTWSAYEFQSYSAVPQEWINTRNAIHENESQLLSCGPFESESYHIFNGLTTVLNLMVERDRKGTNAFNRQGYEDSDTDSDY